MTPDLTLITSPISNDTTILVATPQSTEYGNQMAGKWQLSVMLLIWG